MRSSCSTPTSTSTADKRYVIRSNFRSTKCCLNNEVSRHHFNRKYEIFIPNTTSCDEDDQTKQLDIVEKYFNQSPTAHPPQTFKLETTLHEFIETLTNNTQKLLSLKSTALSDFYSQFHCLTINTSLDGDYMSFVVLPPGYLVISMAPSVYRRLGFNGQKINFTSNSNRYHVTIDMTKSEKQLSSFNHKALSLCQMFEQKVLKNRFHLLIYIERDAAGIEVDDNTVGGVDLVDIFPSAELQTTGPKDHPQSSLLELKLRRDIQVPLIQDSNVSGKEFSRFYGQFQEWLGFISLDIDYNSSEFFTRHSFDSLAPFTPAVGIVIRRYKNKTLIGKTEIKNAVEKMSKYIIENTLPYACITVWGYEDVPVINDMNPNGKLAHSAVNMYSIVVFPNNNYWIYTCYGAYNLSY